MMVTARISFNQADVMRTMIGGRADRTNIFPSRSKVLEAKKGALALMALVGMNVLRTNSEYAPHTPT